MANFYTDHPEYDFYLNHPEMQRVVELKERNFADKDKYEDAPVDFEDAIENYKRVLEITGDIAANIIEPNSEDVDLEGPHLVDGRMHRIEDLRQHRGYTPGWLVGYLYASSLQRLEHAYHSVLYGLGDCFGCRCRLPEHLVAAGLHRDSLRVRFRGAAPEVHPACLRRRDNVYGPYRA